MAMLKRDPLIILYGIWMWGFVSIWRWIARKNDTVTPLALSAIRDKRRVHTPWMTECVTKRRGPIKDPRNDSRSLYLAHWRTPLESEFIVWLIMGPAWQPIVSVYLLRSRWSFIMLRGIRCLFLVTPDYKLQTIEACNLKKSKGSDKWVAAEIMIS